MDTAVRSWRSCSKTTDENPRPSTKTMFGNEGFCVDLSPIISVDMVMVQTADKGVGLVDFDHNRLCEKSAKCMLIRDM